MKPILIFTNFWDVLDLLKNKILIANNKEDIYKIFFEQKRTFFHSVSLVAPKGFESFEILDILCPKYFDTYNYHKNNNWEEFKKIYKETIRARKEDIYNWLINLEEDSVNFICCWEEITSKVHCHRSIIYDVFTKSEKTKDKAIFIERKGKLPMRLIKDDNKRMNSSRLGMTDNNDPVSWEIYNDNNFQPPIAPLAISEIYEDRIRNMNYYFIGNHQTSDRAEAEALARTFSGYYDGFNITPEAVDITESERESPRSEQGERL